MFGIRDIMGMFQKSLSRAIEFLGLTFQTEIEISIKAKSVRTFFRFFVGHEENEKHLFRFSRVFVPKLRMIDLGARLL